MMKDKDVLRTGAIMDVWRLPVKIWHPARVWFCSGYPHIPLRLCHTSSPKRKRIFCTNGVIRHDRIISSFMNVPALCFKRHISHQKSPFEVSGQRDRAVPLWIHSNFSQMLAQTKAFFPYMFANHQL